VYGGFPVTGSHVGRGRGRCLVGARIARVGASVVATALRVRPHVGLADPTAGTAPVDDGDVDAQFAGESTGRRRREGPAGRGVGLRLGVGFRVGLGADVRLRLRLRGVGSRLCGVVSSRLDVFTVLSDAERDDHVADGDDISLLDEQLLDGPVVPRGTSTSALSVSTSATG